MELVSIQDIETLTKIANRLPDKQRKELLALVASLGKCERESSRTQYEEHVRFITEKDNYSGTAKDLSPSGIFIEGSDKLDIGEQVEIFLSAPSSSMPINISGTVVRHSLKGIGIRFN